MEQNEEGSEEVKVPATTAETDDTALPVIPAEVKVPIPDAHSTGEEAPALGGVPDPPAEAPSPTVPAKVQVPAHTDTEIKTPATPAEGEAPQAPAPVTTEAPPGEEPATPEANNQAILTEVNTPVEDEIPTPGKVPNVLAADEMPAKPVEVEVPTMSEEDENPLTTIKVPPAADVDEKLVEEASDMPKPKLDVIRVRSSSGNTVLVKREKPKKLMKDGLTGVVPVETSSVLYTGLTLASLSRKKSSGEEEAPEEILLAEDDDNDGVRDDTLVSSNKRKQN